MCVLLLAVTLSLGLSLIDLLFPLELANLASLQFSPVHSSGAEVLPSFSSFLPRLCLHLQCFSSGQLCLLLRGLPAPALAPLQPTHAANLLFDLPKS